MELRQCDLQVKFTLEKETYANWEKDRCYPAMRHWPNIISFLGYDPTPAPVTLGEQLLAYRRRSGLNRKALAFTIGIDEATLWRWEIDQRRPDLSQNTVALLALLLWG